MRKGENAQGVCMIKAKEFVKSGYGRSSIYYSPAGKF